MRQIAATRRRDRLLQQIASCDMWKSLSLRSVAQIQTGLNSCDISQRQTKRKRLVAAAVQTRRLVASCVSAYKLVCGPNFLLRNTLNAETFSNWTPLALLTIMISMQCYKIIFQKGFEICRKRSKPRAVSFGMVHVNSECNLLETITLIFGSQ